MILSVIIFPVIPNRMHLFTGVHTEEHVCVCVCVTYARVSEHNQ
jgi:hypothetical protein